MSEGDPVVIKGSGTAVATLLSVGTAPVTVAVANRGRSAVQLYPAGGPLFLSYGATAVPSQGMSLASGVPYRETHYNGLIGVVGGTVVAPLFVVEIGF